MKKQGTERLDKILVRLGLAETRSRGQRLISEGKVKVNGRIIRKASFPVVEHDHIEITQKLRYVARSGYKLEHALDTFVLDVKDKICIDIGASTGGFTQCLLEHGARRVYAVDVGTGQLHSSLMANPRIINLERTDARKINSVIVPDKINIFVADLSFISSIKVLPHILPLLENSAQGVLLIKPQFELTPNEVKGGIVSSALLHRKAIGNVVTGLNSHGLSIVDLTYSPIKGGSGNIEFLALLSVKNTYIINREKIKEVVDLAHKILKR